MATAGTTAPSSPTSPTPADAGRSGRTSGTNRRRQRSTRLVVAAALVALAVLAVAGTAVPGSWLVAVVGGGVAALLGAIAVRMTYAEVLATRREAASDRARQAQGYRAITEVRTTEQAAFAVEMQGRVARHEATIGRLEKRLEETTDEVVRTRSMLADAQAEAVLAQGELARAVVELEESTTRADRLTHDLLAAQDRAGQAVVRVAELEQELDIVTAQWQALERGERRHA